MAKRTIPGTMAVALAAGQALAQQWPLIGGPVHVFEGHGGT
jgi:hypothetical protein